MASSATSFPGTLQSTMVKKTSQYQDGALPMAASTALMPGSGRYLTANGSGFFALSGASSTQLDAWTEDCYGQDFTGTYSRTSSLGYITSSTNGGSVVQATRKIHSEDDAVIIYSADTLSVSYIGLQCDLIVTGSGLTSIQQVKPTVTTNKVVQILDVILATNQAIVFAIK